MACNLAGNAKAMQRLGHHFQKEGHCGRHNYTTLMTGIITRSLFFLIGQMQKCHVYMIWSLLQHIYKFFLYKIYWDFFFFFTWNPFHLYSLSSVIFISTRCHWFLLFCSILNYNTLSVFNLAMSFFFFTDHIRSIWIILDPLK